MKKSIVIIAALFTLVSCSKTNYITGVSTQTLMNQSGVFFAAFNQGAQEKATWSIDSAWNVNGIEHVRIAFNATDILDGQMNAKHFTQIQVNTANGNSTVSYNLQEGGIVTNEFTFASSTIPTITSISVN